MRHLATLLFCLISLGTCKAAVYYTNPVLPGGADPWIIKHDGQYYYCCTMPGNRIGVSVSGNLHQINKPVAVWKAPEKGAWNSRCIWAPELHFWNNKWYIYYAAGFSGPPYVHQKSGVLESVTSSPLGEYVDKGMLFTGDDYGHWDKNIWAIDLTTFEHQGTLYAVWSGWENNADTDKTQQHLYIAKMENPWTITGPRVKISSPDKDYEQGRGLPLNEGPEILKHRNDVFIIYSCGQSWLSTYKLAYLKLKPASDPLKKESWVKGDAPLFQGNENAFGVGHASFTTSPDDKEYYILYHSKVEEKPGWKRDVRLQKFYFDKNGLPYFGEPVPLNKKLKVPSGTKN